MASTQTPGNTEPTTIDSPIIAYWSGTETVQALETSNLVGCAFVRQGATAAEAAFFQLRLVWPPRGSSVTAWADTAIGL
jgi:hypothetical protein